jgi:hypothetical protein
MFLAVTVLVISCGGTQGIALGGDPDPMICRNEVSTGTNINRVVCRPRSDVDVQHKAAQDWRMRNGSDPTKGGVHTTTDPFTRRR